jgi:hypothetical protein
MPSKHTAIRQALSSSVNEVCHVEFMCIVFPGPFTCKPLASGLSPLWVAMDLETNILRPHDIHCKHLLLSGFKR